MLNLVHSHPKLWRARGQNQVIDEAISETSEILGRSNSSANFGVYLRNFGVGWDIYDLERIHFVTTAFIVLVLQRKGAWFTFSKSLPRATVNSKEAFSISHPFSGFWR
jgi:hypothetical protein